MLRFTPDGAPDSTFGTAGVSAFYLGGRYVSSGIALQAGGKIVIAGMEDPLGGDIHLLQLNPDGLLDTSFGDLGFVRTNIFEPTDSFPFPSIDFASAVLVQPDSMIVVVGHAYHRSNVQHLVALRYSPNGVLNKIMLAVPGGFGGSGYVDTREEGLAAALQPDGKIVAAGAFYARNNKQIWEPNFFLVRFKPDGGTDGDFDGNGLKIINMEDYDRARAVALLPDGKILAAGHAYKAYKEYDLEVASDIAAVRLNADGLLDTTFQHTGILVAPAGVNNDRGTDVALQPDGKILVGAVIDTIGPYVVPSKPGTGDAESGSDPNFLIFQNVPKFEVVRYEEDGTLDLSFGIDGRVGFSADEPSPYFSDYDFSLLYSFPRAPLKTAIAQRKNGNILVAGSREFDFGVAEFYPDGSQDSLFLGTPGSQLILPIVRKIDFSSYGPEVATAIVLDTVFAPISTTGFTVAGHSNGKVAVAWCCYVPNLGNATRRAIIPVGPYYDYATAVGYQTGSGLNKVNTVVGGYYLEDYYAGANPRLFLMRLLDEDMYQYALDPNFGDFGIVYGNVGTASDLINAFAIQPDNTIVAAGAVDDQMAVFKFLPDGGFDPGFGNAGVVILPEGLEASDLIVQPKGKIAVTGHSAGRVVTARLLADGQRDPKFGVNGVLITDLRGKKDRGLAIARQDDGKIVVAGSSDDPFAGTDLAVMRYLPNSNVPPLDITNSIQAVSCPGGADGQLAVSAAGGVPPYTFEWNTGATGPTLGGLTAGAYTVTVADSEGQQQIIHLTVPEPAALEGGIAVETEVTCNNLPGTAVATPEGGTPPYTLQWSNGAATLTALLPAGIFTLTLTDAHGCTAAFEGDMPAIPDTVAPVLTCPAAVITQACIEPVNYPLPGAADNCTVIGLHLVAGLPPGSVFPVGVTVVKYEVADEAGNTSACTFEVRVQNTLSLNIDANPGCAGALNTLTALASGGTPPYQYAWSNSATGVSILAPSGQYTVTLTDAPGCTSTSTAFVQEYPPVTVVATVTPAWVSTSNGSIQAVASGGEPPFEYAWFHNGQPVGADSMLANIPAGVYSLVVTDAAGCTAASDWTVTEVVATGEPENVLRCRVFPNPFAQTFILQVELRRSAEIRWAITDLAGRMLDQQYAGPTGFLQTEWNGSNLAPGLYVLQVWVNGETLYRKLVKI